MTTAHLLTTMRMPLISSGGLIGIMLSDLEQKPILIATDKTVSNFQSPECIAVTRSKTAIKANQNKRKYSATSEPCLAVIVYLWKLKGIIQGGLIRGGLSAGGISTFLAPGKFTLQKTGYFFAHCTSSNPSVSPLTCYIYDYQEDMQ